jgi:Uncharacterized conserved protein (DUF2358)
LRQDKPVDIVEALKADYARFPANQTYSLYAENVWFKDPLTSFRGVERYRSMIGFMGRWFKAIDMELHNIQQRDQRIDTTWTLRWIAPVPWQSKISISGRSELTLNEAGLIQSHVDYWDCSRLDVLKQLFFKAP